MEFLRCTDKALVVPTLQLAPPAELCQKWSDSAAQLGTSLLAELLFSPVMVSRMMNDEELSCQHYKQSPALQFCNSSNISIIMTGF